MFSNSSDCLLGLTLAIVLGLTVGCSPTQRPQSDELAVRFAEVVDFQTGNVTTDLISVPEGLGLEAVGAGWRRIDSGDADDSGLAIIGKTGRLRVFSTGGDLEEIEVELRLSKTQGGQAPVHLRWNGERIARFHPTGEWSSYKAEVPAGSTRIGVNVLDVAPRSRERRKSDRPGTEIHMRRARLRWSGARPLWIARPPQIVADDGLEMPVSSLVDLVIEIPEGSRLQGTWSFEASGPSTGSAHAFIEMWGESGIRRTLFHKRLYRSVRRGRDIDLDLSRWTGERVRFRAAVVGATNGVFRWRDLRLTGTTLSSFDPAIPPIRRQSPPRSGRLGRPDVLVILMDAARADAFSPWGGAHPSPSLERLAADGTVFSQAMSPAPWTGQAVPAILTGLFPDSLGVGPWGSRMPDEIPTLAEILSRVGYRTVLWSQHPFYTNHSTFRRGFEEFHRSPKGDYQVLPSAENLMAEDRPTFAFVHLIPPHAPYRPPAPFLGSFTGWYDGDMSAEANHLSTYPRRTDEESLTADDRRFVYERYLENAAFADDLVGRTLAKLDQAGRYEETLIVVISDHGEAFMEHGRFLHTNEVHREFLHVPFVIKWPQSLAGTRSTVTEALSLIDLTPTLADGLGAEIEGDGFQGRSLLPTVLDNQPLNRPVYAVTRGWHDPDRAPKTKLMLDTGRWRLLLAPEGNQTKLYDAVADPLETKDLAPEQPTLALLLRQAALSQWHANQSLLGPTGAPEKVDELDEETREQLEALGYLN